VHLLAEELEQSNSSAAHFITLVKVCNEISKQKKTFNNGSLGLLIDEERSEM
jgi:hypothetical protein